MPLVTALGLWCGGKLSGSPKKDLSVLALVTDAFGSHGGIAQYNQDLLSALALSSRVGDILVVPRHGASPRDGLPERVVPDTAEIRADFLRSSRTRSCSLPHIVRRRVLWSSLHEPARNPDL